ncbi:hypothetical protein BPA30113_03322 [Burkholderia paludis]|uniref:Uncharacterized protein n=1 Tax=Burkholderia paludis TaxID=1506587 RepID=A0A6J5E0E5_9BURK|nr:hypothetical protein LMG30113_03227 [Burkholderia paludis]VWB73415.1 hypothetical protein BPA30113_03322 [Burkholderia paludis]
MSLGAARVTCHGRDFCRPSGAAAGEPAERPALTRGGDFPAWPPSLRQHSTMFTAKPPRDVSLYFVFMSAPVSRIVLITESSDT